MMAAQSSVDDLYALLHRSTALYAKGLQEMAEAVLSDDISWQERTVENLADLIQHTLALSNLLGRRRLLLEADAVRDQNRPYEGMVTFNAESGEGITNWEVKIDTPMVPNVPFREAIDDLLRREPRALSAEVVSKYPKGTPKYKIVQQMYSKEHVFALARSNQDHVTKNIQKTMARFMKEGVSIDDAAGRLLKKKILDGQEGWSRAYAETSYRTTINGSFNQGLREMANDDDVASVIGGFEFTSVRDRDTRENHRAADGLIAAQDSAQWDRFTPPLGYNCRCALRLVGRWELEERGLLNVRSGKVEVHKPKTFSKARPDPGFNGEPQR